jgi:hypothetical protein
MDVHVSRHGRNRQNLNLRGPQRHNQRHGVVGSGIGIDQKWRFHAP